MIPMMRWPRLILRGWEVAPTDREVHCTRWVFCQSINAPLVEVTESKFTTNTWLHGYFQNTFSSLDTEGADVLDPSIANSNPTTAFMSTPYFVGLFNHTNQQPRPPPCYLRPKKLCQNCLDKRTSASTDQRTPEGVQTAAAAAAAALAPGAAQHANSSDSIAGGRSMYHSPGCKQAYPSSSNAIGSVIPMQPTLNSLNQLTWNFKTPGKKLSDPGTCNHYSHYPYRSPTHRASVHSFPSSTDASTSKSGGSSAAAARKSDANPPSAQAPTASTASHNEYAPYRRFPVIAAKYFDNKYYEIHSGHVRSDLGRL